MLRALTVSGFLMAAGLTLTPRPRTSSPAARRSNDLLAEHWEYTLSHSPEFASILGDKRWNDKSSDVSAGADASATSPKSREFLARFEAIDTTGFPEQEALNKTLMVRDLARAARRRPVRELADAGQPDGRHPPRGAAARLAAAVRDRQGLRRLRRAACASSRARSTSTIGFMRKGMAKQPDAAASSCSSKVAAQAQGIAAQEAGGVAVRAAAVEVPESVLGRGQGAPPRRGARRRSATRCCPPTPGSRRSSRRSTRREGRTERRACGRCPTATRATRSRVQRSTTTDMTPEEIHQLGLARGGAHRGRDAGDRQAARLRRPEELPRRDGGEPEAARRSRASRSSTSTRKYIDAM